MSTTDQTLLDQLAGKLGMSVADLRAAVSASREAPTVAAFIGNYLARSTARTRNTYGDHLNRLLRGVGPVCEQLCPACLTPVKSISGMTSNNRPIYVTDYVCSCECVRCRQSRITIEPIGHLPVGPDVFTVRLAADLTAVARRYAVKTGVNRNRRRAARNRPLVRGDGHNAEETALNAMRCIYKLAAEHIGATNLSDTIQRPKRHPKERRSLQPFELAELVHVTGAGGNDPELDLLIVDTVIATGARVKGVPALTVGQLHLAAQLIDIKDKGDHTMPMPVSRQLIERLLAHAIERGGQRCNPASPFYVPDSPVFYYHRPAGYRPFTERRIDYISGRWQAGLDWAREEQVGFHHIRHTIAALLAAHFGPQYKKRYLRHADDTVTDVYGKAQVHDLAVAMGELLGFEHPLVVGLEARRKSAVERLRLGSVIFDN
jgi:integrase